MTTNILTDAVRRLLHLQQVIRQAHARNRVTPNGGRSGSSTPT